MTTVEVKIKNYCYGTSISAPYASSLAPYNNATFYFLVQ